MIAAFYIVGGLILVVILAAIAGGFSSRRLSIPCPAWLGWMVELDNPLFRNNRAQSIIERLGAERGMKVLDFGCGPGRLTLPLARQVGPAGEVTALDIQPKMLQRVREKAQAEKLGNIRFVRAGMEEEKPGQNHYDRAILVTVLGEISDQKAALKEIFDSLKPGGLLSVTEVIADPHFQRRGKVASLADAVGFKESAFYGNRFSYTIHFEKPAEGR